MKSAGEVARQFYQAVVKRDLATARTFLADDLVFVGLFETYHGPQEYLTALTGLLGVTVRLDVKTIIGEGNQAAVFFELETKSPVQGTTFVAEWFQVESGLVRRVQSAFDGRLFASMFTGGK